MYFKNLTLATLGGTETEYPFSAFDERGRRLDPTLASAALMRAAAAGRAHLPSSQDKGAHFANGGKLYQEAGVDHDYGIPEFASAEFDCPFEGTRQVEAGNLLIQEACARLPEHLPEARSSRVFRHNVDHLSRTSWATHLNVLTTSGIPLLAEQLVPHLVSKVIFAGGGGFAFDGPFQFSLGPRMATFSTITSRHTTHERPLLNNRDLSHCSVRARRQHLIGFEILCSHLARVLDLGTTMLVMRMIDAGLTPGAATALEHPIAALHTFCGDLRCSAAVPRANKAGTITAIGIQRHCLELTMAHLDQPWMPAWAPKLCQLWDETLKLLEQGAPDSVADRLDWAIKHAIFAEHIARNGGSWEKCRAALLELDLRFGMLGGGIFEQLNERGLLAHRVPGVDRIELAMSEPPPRTRASVRGAAIKELHEAGLNGTAHWDRVVDLNGNRHLDLGDPFMTDTCWHHGK